MEESTKNQSFSFVGEQNSETNKTFLTSQQSENTNEASGTNFSLDNVISAIIPDGYNLLQTTNGITMTTTLPKEGLWGPGPGSGMTITILDSSVRNEFNALELATIGSDVPEAHHAVSVVVNKLGNTVIDEHNAVEYIIDGISIPLEQGRGPIPYSHNFMIKVNENTYVRISNFGFEISDVENRDRLFSSLISSISIP